MRFVVLKILNNLVFIQDSLNSEISKTVQCDLNFILNVLSESSIQFTQFSIVLAKKCYWFQIKWF